MQWYIILVIVLVVLILPGGLALAWFMNVSALRQVISDVRRRGKRRAEALKRSEKLA